jgi:hypothetical protein
MHFEPTLDYGGLIEMVGVAVTLICGGFAFMSRIERRFTKLETQMSLVLESLGRVPKQAAE